MSTQPVSAEQLRKLLTVLEFDPEVIQKVMQDIFDESEEQILFLRPKHKELRERIKTILKDMCIPTHIWGYVFLQEAILMVVKDWGILKRGIVKNLYPEIAKKYDSTGSRVERSIRHAIDIAWKRSSMETLEAYFGHSISHDMRKATNLEFIAQIAEIVSDEISNY